MVMLKNVRVPVELDMTKLAKAARALAICTEKISAAVHELADDIEGIGG
jgi:hypothetical protein